MKDSKNGKFVGLVLKHMGKLNCGVCLQHEIEGGVLSSFKLPYESSLYTYNENSGRLSSKKYID